VGRVEELEKLSMSLKDKNKNIAYIWAPGGIGKSALTFQWLKNMQPEYCNVEKVFAWSFYSQGSHDTQNSSTAFFEEALPFFGCPKEKIPKDDTAKGRLLVKYLNNQSFILILDGLEPLQHRVKTLDGELKDVGIRALIDELFYHGLKVENSLILISSRQPLKELESWDKEKYLNLDLKTLNEKDSIQLLQNLGVKGVEKEFKQTFEEIQGHALSLILLGKLLVNDFEGDIQKRDQLPKLWKEKKLGNHTQRILQYYWNLWKRKWWQFWIKEETPEQAFLCLLGLFDRPMGLLEKELLIEQAEISNPLKSLNNLQFKKIEKRLENAGLLLKSDAILRMEWDCHPLIREFIGEQFKKTHFNLFQQAHLKLFEFYQRLPEKDQPDTPEELAPLYRAVVHGCLAGEYKKAMYEVYWERIRRKNEGYNLHKLGLYSEDLSALAAFFPQGWSQPIQQGLSEADQALLLAAASFCLMSLGRLAEAIEPRQAGLKIRVKTNDWKNASITAQNLMDLMLPSGRLTEAVTAAQQALDYGKQSEDLFEQLKNHAYLATVLHRLGKLEESKHHFEQAEQLQKERQPNNLQLYSLLGFQYCALLLDQAIKQHDVEMVLKRGEKILEVHQNSSWSFQLDFALSYLTLARAYFKLNELEKAGSYFNQAVDGIRKAGINDLLPEFLIDRANFSLEINEIKKGLRDLSEAKQLISRSGMKLYEVDYHLAMCHFLIKTNSYMSSHAGAWELENGSDARAQERGEDSFLKHLTAAKTLIKSTGYHLRDKNILELEILEEKIMPRNMQILWNNHSDVFD
jgi:tetratricopeptide (TPR) repeat protein